MIPLQHLRDWLLDELHRTPAGSPKHRAVSMMLDEMRSSSNAQHLIDQLTQDKKELEHALTELQKRVEASYEWDIWAYYPLERIEGPYTREDAYERMLTLNDQSNRHHIIVIVGSDQERHYRTVASSRERSV